MEAKESPFSLPISCDRLLSFRLGLLGKMLYEMAISLNRDRGYGISAFPAIKIRCALFNFRSIRTCPLSFNLNTSKIIHH